MNAKRIKKSEKKSNNYQTRVYTRKSGEGNGMQKAWNCNSKIQRFVAGESHEVARVFSNQSDRSKSRKFWYFVVPGRLARTTDFVHRDAKIEKSSDWRRDGLAKRVACMRKVIRENGNSVERGTNKTRENGVDRGV